MKNTVITGFIVGFIASIAFILVQPIFGMATLTSRHAAAYINFGAYGETVALLLSWFVHVSVSIFYGVLSTAIFYFNSSIVVNAGQVVALGWFTTLIATPANEFVVKLVTTKQFPDLTTLAALNTQTGPKLWLHILFFVFVVGALWFIKIKKLRFSPT
jgi:hypothetical protein